MKLTDFIAKKAIIPVLKAQDKKGAIHHTAVVTAVTPDGDIRYTQHSGDMKNGSIGGRIDAFQEGRGHQKLHFVRVNPDWY